MSSEEKHKKIKEALKKSKRDSLKGFVKDNDIILGEVRDKIKKASKRES